MARKNGQTQERTLDLRQVSTEVLDAATEERAGRLRTRLRIGHAMAHRHRPDVTAKLVAQDVRELAKERAVPAPSGLSEAALSKAEKVYVHYIASDAVTVDQLVAMGASFEKLYANVDDDAATVIAEYHDRRSSPKRVPSGRVSINVSPELRDDLYAIAKDRDLDEGAWMEKTITALIAYYRTGTMPSAHEVQQQQATAQQVS